MKKTIIFALTLMASWQTSVWAQDTEPADSIAGYEMLDELVVQGERPLLQSDGAKTTYNVEEDPGAAAANVLDMLKKVPMVSVDGEGKVKLNGKGNFKFQVNGLDNPMLSQYADQVLKAMPAGSVMKIEVITEPGAKEDAEGGAGIINIVMQRKQDSDGYFGNLNANINNLDAGVGAYGIVKHDKTTLSANVNYQTSLDSQVSTSESLTRYTAGDSGFLDSYAEQRQKFNYLGGNLDFSWEPNAANLFNAGANATWIEGDLTGLESRDTRLDDAGKTLWRLYQGGSADFKMLSVSANASYRHNFAPEGNNLILSYLFNFGRQHLGLDRNTTLADGISATAPLTSNVNTNYTREHTVQLDYTNNFRSEHHLLETGLKGIFRRNGSMADYYEGDTYPLLPLTDSRLRLAQPQDVYAVYASYTGNFGPLSVLGGVRYEHSRLGIRYHSGDGHDFTQRLNDIVPNAALTWTFSPASNMRLAYQMRIMRPSISQVNPYLMELSPFDGRQGNPELDSEKTNKISLNYTNFGRIFGGSIGIEQSLTDNSIAGFSYTRLTPEGYSQTITTYANIGSQRTTTLSGFLNWNIIQHMSLNVSGGLNYQYFKAPAENFRNSGWDGYLNASWNYTVAEVWKFNAWGGWSSRSISLQGWNSGWNYYGISASRDLLADRSLTIGVNASNFISPRESYRSHSDNHTAITDNCWTNRNNWRVGLSLTWKFGKLQAQVKKTGANLTNDDTSSASNKGQSGI